MISFEMERELINAGFNISKPTFEELWAMLPKFIDHSGTRYRLELFSHCGCNFLSYMSNKPRLSFMDMAYHESKSLSDLAAEMLIELKNRGMM